MNLLAPKHLPQRLTLSFICLTLGAPAVAVEWRVEPSVSASATVDDNIRLQSDSSLTDTAYGGILEPGVQFRALTPVWELSAGGRLQFQRYWGVDGVDQNNQYFDVSASRQFERSSFDITGTVVHDTSLNDTVDPDAGLTTDKVRRLRLGADASWDYQLSERYFLTTGLTGYDTTYSDRGTSGLVDSYFIRPSVGLGYQYSPRTRLNVFYNYGYIKPDEDLDTQGGITDKSSTNSVLAGFEHSVTERLNINFAGGVRRTSIDSKFLVFDPATGTISTQSDSETDSGFTFDGGFTYGFDNGEWGLRASRDVRPSSNGTSSDRTSVIFNGRRRWTERFTTSLSASFFRNRTAGGNNDTANDRDNYRIAPTLSYKLTRDLSIDGRYVFRHVERDTGGNASSNAGFVALRYDWPRISVSR